MLIMKSILGNYTRASSLVDTPNSCLTRVSHVMDIPLPCEYMGNFRSAITITLDDTLGIYDVELKGVPVAYNKKTVKFADRHGDMIGVQRIIHCKIKCDYIVFVPKIDSVLEGIVNKVTAKFIGCLVHGCFYASIHHKTPIDNKCIGVKVGDAVKLRMAKLEEDGSGVLSIIGEICGVEPKRRKQMPQHDFVTSDVVSSVDSGMEDVFTSRDSGTVMEGCDNISLTLSDTENECTLHNGAEYSSQHDVASKDTAEAKKKKKDKKKDKKKRKDKKKHKEKKNKKDKDRISEKSHNGAEQHTIHETIIKHEPVEENSCTISPGLRSWLESSNRQSSLPSSESLVVPEPSIQMKNESYAVNAVITSAQSDQTSSDYRSWDKTSPRKGVKRKLSHQDGTSPKRKAISNSSNSWSNDSLQEDKESIIKFPASVTSDNPLTSIIEVPKNTKKGGYSSLSSVEETIENVIRRYSEQTANNIMPLETASKWNQPPEVTTGKSMNSSRIDTPQHVTKEVNHVHSSDNTSSYPSAKKTKLVESPGKQKHPAIVTTVNSTANGTAQHIAKAANPVQSSDKISSNHSAKKAKRREKNLKNGGSKHATKKDDSVITIDDVASVPAPSKTNALAAPLDSKNSQFIQQLMQMGWTPPPNVVASMSKLAAGMQFNNNVVAAPVVPNVPLDSSCSSSRAEKSPKKKKKKTTSDSKPIKMENFSEEDDIVSLAAMNSTTDEMTSKKKKSKKKKKHKHAT